MTVHLVLLIISIAEVHAHTSIFLYINIRPSKYIVDIDFRVFWE